jgi:hypothetical protein
MVKKIGYLILLMLLFPANASAAKFAHVALTHLFKQADCVAVIRIESGELVPNGAALCGVKYEGRVLDAIKGVSKDEIMEFGSECGSGLLALEVGSKYLVFIAKPGRSNNRYAANILRSKQEGTKTAESCGSALPGMRVIHSPVGTMLVGGVAFGEPVSISTSVRLPPSLKIEYTFKRGQYSWEPDHVEVYLKDLVAFLRHMEVDPEKM